ncbi:DoxX family protein [Flavobacterium sp. YJ01]|uniref:DoxX family protein n=1 Tax=unclassified Flavobacterium TaxID=196869 RepID=UPI0023E36B87|nr:DoxX family protein [Flavobacterium sp. YJ01]WET03682.1 DoxX family protein [Flavobacterium sp. YJ01]
MILPWHLYLMAFLYIGAGINHFRKPRMYIKIIPPFFQNTKLINILSGAAEIILGILLTIPATKIFAAWGIIALLIAVFPANLYMFQNKKAGFGLPRWILFVRLLLQIVLIYWAYQYIF